MATSRASAFAGASSCRLPTSPSGWASIATPCGPLSPRPLSTRQRVHQMLHRPRNRLRARRHRRPLQHHRCSERGHPIEPNGATRMSRGRSRRCPEGEPVNVCAPDLPPCGELGGRREPMVEQAGCLYSGARVSGAIGHGSERATFLRAVPDRHLEGTLTRWRSTGAIRHGRCRSRSLSAWRRRSRLARHSWRSGTSVCSGGGASSTPSPTMCGICIITERSGVRCAMR